MGSVQQGCCLKSEPETWVLDSMHAWSFSSRFWPIPAQAWGCNIHIEIGSSSRTHCWMNKQFILKLDPCDGGMFNFDRTHNKLCSKPTNCIHPGSRLNQLLGWHPSSYHHGKATSCLVDSCQTMRSPPAWLTNHSNDSFPHDTNRFHTLDKKWIIEVIRWELNPLTCNWIRNNDLK